MRVICRRSAPNAMRTPTSRMRPLTMCGSDRIATAMENTEAARSNLLDLDVAAEMTKMTSKQILVQAGVAMLAQANQTPQMLLRLFQQ